MGTTTGILTKIMEVVVPQTSSSNLVKMPTILYGCLLHLLLRGFNFSPTQMEGTGATVGENTPVLTNTNTIGSLQWQTAGEPHAPYHIKPPCSRPREGNRLPKKLITTS
jgi:hypothetical protein